MKKRSLLQKKRVAGGYVACLSLLTASFVLMPFDDTVAALRYVAGAAFWLGLIGTVCMAVLLCRCAPQKKLGVLQFFTNNEAKVFDSTMLLALLGFIIAKLCEAPLWLMFVLWALFVFSFGMHCMVNGTCYVDIKNNDRRDAE